MLHSVSFFLKLFLVDDHDDDELYLSANEIRISACSAKGDYAFVNWGGGGGRHTASIYEQHG